MPARPRLLPGVRSAAIAVVLVAAPDHVAVARIELDGKAAPAELLASDQGRARAREEVEHVVAAAAPVASGGRAELGRDQLDRLHVRVRIAPARPVDEEDRALGIVALPAAAGMPSAPGPSGP